MTRVALVSSEPVRERMAGIGICYLELARRLPRPGIEAVLLSPAEPQEAPPAGVEVRRLIPGRIAELLADCDAAVAQGQLANDLLLECPELPVAIDLYDPWLVENLHYLASLGAASFSQPSRCRVAFFMPLGQSRSTRKRGPSVGSGRS